jgi:fumarate reductase subunit D
MKKLIYFMSYIRNYKSFVKEQKKYADKQSNIIKGQIYTELSESFWSLCLESDVFNSIEKSFIKNELIDSKVDLVKEEWEFLDKAVKYVKDKGEKFVNSFKERVKKIIDGISWFVKGIMAFCKNVFLGMLNGALDLGKKLSLSKKKEIDAKLKSTDQSKLKEEIPNLKVVFNYLRTGDEKKSALETNQLNPNLSKKIGSTLESGEANIESTTLKELQETEDQVGESNSFIEITKDDDVIKHFYEYRLFNEATAEIKSSAFNSLVEWFKSFTEKSTDPDVSTGKKLIWWGRVILRVLSSFFGLIVKVAELVGEVVTNASLTLISKISQWSGGPGPFKFVALGAIVGALVGIVGDVCLLVGATPFPGMEAAMDLKKWFLAAFNLYAETDPIGKTIKVILTVAAIGFAIYHVHHTIHELKGHGHDEGEEHGGVEKTGSEKTVESPNVKPSIGVVK